MRINIHTWSISDGVTDYHRLFPWNECLNIDAFFIFRGFTFFAIIMYMFCEHLYLRVHY